MAIKSTIQQIEDIQAAIEQALASQEMGGGGDRIRRPDIDALFRQEARLLARYETETGKRRPAFNTGILRYD